MNPLLARSLLCLGLTITVFSAWADSRPSKVGKLEVSATKATVRVVKDRDSACVSPTIRLQIKNVSATDLRIGLLIAALEARDNFGNPLFTDGGPKISGISELNDRYSKISTKSLLDVADSMSILSPDQFVDIQFTTSDSTNNMRCVKDLNAEFPKTYKPTSYTISGSLGTVDANGKAEIRGFSLVDQPLDLIAK